jgi:FtsX-like permease family
MPALGIRFRAELRSRWRAWVTLVLVTAGAGGLLVAMAAASRRTETAYDRFLVAAKSADAYVGWGLAWGNETLDVDRIARLPQVVASDRRLLLAYIARSRSGRPLYPFGPGALEIQVPSDGHIDRIDRPRLVEGRLPDSSRPNEVLADTRSMQVLGLNLGEATTIRFFSRRVLVHGKDVPLTVDPRKARVGPLVRLKVVGIEAHWRTDVDAGYLHLTPAFYRAYGGRQIGSWAEQLPVRLERGQADLPAFKAGVQRIAGEGSYGLFEPDATLPKVRRSIDLQARALLLLTAFGGVAAILLTGQALFRQALSESAAWRTLRALGMTRGQLMALGTLRTAGIASAATVLSVPVAFLLSPLAPVGRARDLEPDPGFHFDPTVLVAGAAVVFTAVLLLGLVGTARAVGGAAPTERAGQPRRRGVVTSALARAGFPPPAVAGAGMALQRGPRAAGVPVRATLVAVIAAVGVTGAALTFASSLQHLLDTPRLYGQTWDFETAWGGPAVDAKTRRLVTRDPAYSDVGVGIVEPVQLRGKTVGARAIDDLKGSTAPTVLDGRAPRAPGEVLVGTKTLDAFDLRIGDHVAVRGGAGAVRLRIVGRGVLPSTKWNKISEGAAFSFRDLTRIKPDVAASMLQARIAPGADRDAAMHRLSVIFGSPSLAVRPTDVGDFGGVEALPLLIVAVFAGAATAALAHALVTSVRRRRRDLAILKTLGFTRPQVILAVAWQATTVAAIGLLIGLPLGLGIGRFAWNVFADDLGVAPEAVTPVGLTVLVIPAAIVLANVIAALPARTAARTQPALVLRAE